MAKKKKSSSNKKKKSGALLPETVAMKKKGAERENPFETIWSRKKFDILGRKTKNQGQRIGLARAVAVDKRKKTLLQEYQKSSKSNVFIDKRFGEKDDALPEEDRALLRFQRVRQAQLQKKSSRYSLQDGDDDILTHHGEALSALDDFKDDIENDEEDTVSLDDKMTDKLSFGGFEQEFSERAAVAEGEKNKHKSKKEIMEEIISKSKFYKAQKAKEKEEDESLKEKLDKDFSGLILSNGLAALMGSKKEIWKSEMDQFNDYEKLVKQMVLDSRAHASDRTKTPEEIAEEERARLEALEEKRKKRMLDSGASDDEVDNETDVDDKSNRKKMKMVSGDDLGDSFSSDEERDKKGWVDEVLARTETNGSEEYSGEDSSASEETDEDAEDTASEGSIDDWEHSDDDHIDPNEDQEKEDAPSEDIEIKSQKLGGKRDSKSKTSEEHVEKKIAIDRDDITEEIEDLPFVINAPSSLEELRSLLDNRPDDQVTEAIRRIRACNAISLASDNRKKMQVFYGVLLQYFAVLADERPFNMKKLNLLVKPLMEISSEIPYFAAICARQRLIRIQNQLSEDAKNPDKTSSWPSVKTVMLLRLWSLIFPASDFRHVVMTPAVLLMSEFLMRCPVNSGRDIAIGTFLCSMLVLVHKDSRRFCPEALSFLQALLRSAVWNKQSSVEENGLRSSSFILHLASSRKWLHVSSEVPVSLQELDFTTIMNSTDDDPLFYSDLYRVGILGSIADSLKSFLKMYEDIASFPEIFTPFESLLLQVVRENKIPEVLETKMVKIAQSIKEKVSQHETLRQPLRMRMQKQVSIKQFNPRFEENFVHGRDYDPDRERAQRKKLQRQLKKEEKGAARELRKDNYFLQDVKAKERVLAEAEREEKYRKAMAFLQEQEHASKSGQLGRSRKKRR